MREVSNPKAEKAAIIERSFLRTLQGGCTAPIGGYAEVKENEVTFSGAVLSLNGKKKIDVMETRQAENPTEFGKEMAKICIHLGAEKLIKEIKENLNS